MRRTSYRVENATSPACRRGEQGHTPGPPPAEETPSSSNAVQGERNTRHDPVPTEEHLTAEDWAIIDGGGKLCGMALPQSTQLNQREKLLAAMCMTFQETVEGNPQRSTVGCPKDFRDWGRRWGTDDAAQLVMQNQCDNLLHHVMGITAAMEVWKPEASSPSALGEGSGSGDVNVTVTEEGEAVGEQAAATEQDGGGDHTPTIEEETEAPRGPRSMP